MSEIRKKLTSIHERFNFSTRFKDFFEFRMFCLAETAGLAGKEAACLADMSFGAKVQQRKSIIATSVSNQGIPGLERGVGAFYYVRVYLSHPNI